MTLAQFYVYWLQGKDPAFKATPKEAPRFAYHRKLWMRQHGGEY